MVSIHAPVMDANRATNAASDWPCFNPRARDGREWAALSDLQGVIVSIHAPVMDAKQLACRSS